MNFMPPNRSKQMQNVSCETFFCHSFMLQSFMFNIACIFLNMCLYKICYQIHRIEVWYLNKMRIPQYLFHVKQFTVSITATGILDECLLIYRRLFHMKLFRRYPSRFQMPFVWYLFVLRCLLQMSIFAAKYCRAGTKSFLLNICLFYDFVSHETFLLRFFGFV